MLVGCVTIIGCLVGGFILFILKKTTQVKIKKLEGKLKDEAIYMSIEMSKAREAYNDSMQRQGKPVSKDNYANRFDKKSKHEIDDVMSRRSHRNPRVSSSHDHILDDQFNLEQNQRMIQQINNMMMQKMMKDLMKDVKASKGAAKKKKGKKKKKKAK